MARPCTIDYGEIYLVALSSKSLARKVTQLASLSPMIHSNKPISMPTDIVEYTVCTTLKTPQVMTNNGDHHALSYAIDPCTDVKTAILGDNLVYKVN